MSTSQSRQRTESVMVRLTPEEKARFTELADRNGMTLPEMFRMAAEAALIGEAVHG
jgi:hypothetical protein